jgi:hypothetical protein
MIEEVKREENSNEKRRKIFRKKKAKVIEN